MGVWGRAVWLQLPELLKNRKGRKKERQAGRKLLNASQTSVRGLALDISSQSPWRGGVLSLSSERLGLGKTKVFVGC